MISAHTVVLRQLVRLTTLRQSLRLIPIGSQQPVSSLIPFDRAHMASKKRTFAAASGPAPAPCAAIDDADWAKVGQWLETYDEQRERVIKRCRDSQKLAKQAVYSLHRGDIARAEQQLKETEAVAQELAPLLAQHPTLRQGSFAASMEEYAEARAFLVFLSEGRLVRADEMPFVEPEEYLGGVLDLTGELNRYAIARATARDREAVQACRDLVDALMGRFLQFNLRNGALRKKYDALKYTLQKMENTLYELSLTDAIGFTKSVAADEPMAGAGGKEGEEEEGA